MQREYSSPRSSWNTHALLTREALRTASGVDLSRKVTVTRLETFLDQVAEELPGIVHQYWKLLQRKSGEAKGSIPLPEAIRTEADFLRAVQLNPKITLFYVRLLTPDEVAADAPHDPSREGPPGTLYLETALRSELTVLDVLFTFSDEPDWGMDQDLFAVAGYRYSKAPFGIATGKSSQGPFHMAFFHENPLFLAVLPQLRKSFLVERAKIFFALAEQAFRTEVDYWGWRFVSWAMHYLQDLTQPYHARACPPAVLPLVFKFLSNPSVRSLGRTIGGVLRNHHMLFEAVVHFLLNEAAKRRSNDELIQALRVDGDSYQGTLEAVAGECSRTAAQLAPVADRLLVRLFDDPRIDDYHFLTHHENQLRLSHEILSWAQSKPEVFGRFRNVLAKCLVEAGRVTRYCVRRFRP